MTSDEHYEFAYRALPTWTFVAPGATRLAMEEGKVDAHLRRVGLRQTLAYEVREVAVSETEKVKALIVVCPEPQESPLAYMVASIPGLPRYFSLERSREGTVLGEWVIKRRGCLRLILAKLNPFSRDGGPRCVHLNYGPGGEPEIDSFVEQIEHVLGGRREAHCIVPQ